MSENKCCGNCKHFKDEDVEGWGCCSKFITQQHVKESECTWYISKFVANRKLVNGWTEITPDNVKELYKTLDRVIIAHIIPDTIIKDVVAYEKPNELYRSLEIIAAIGGYYYYVLPELNIE